jgi:hypothetical protein
MADLKCASLLFYNLPYVLMKTKLTWSLKTFCIPIHHTYFTKHGSYNSMTFMWFSYYASMNLLWLRLLSYHNWLSCHGLEHFIHPSSWTSSSLSRNCWFYYKVSLHHVKILMWISHAPRFYTVGTSYLYMASLSIHIHGITGGPTTSYSFILSLNIILLQFQMTQV